MIKKYICIHGHFYQPPRENPWLEEIQQQDSAFPYHDWNERIHAECYAAHSASRILDESNNVVQLVNNYQDISFNFGPTLIDWIAKKAPETYEAIIEADKKSQKQFSGHGSALAQCYNHMIMPLANEHDKITQVIWGICDFEYRFKRKPEGIWLPETACDLETLEVLAAHEIKFTVLSPYQARRYRPLEGDGKWTELSGSPINPNRTYICKLPSGKTINIVFYNGSISSGIAFEGLLNDGKNLAHRLMSSFDPNIQEAQIVPVATDGETFGHHHRHGDMALAFAIKYLKEQADIKITNFAEFLELNPPNYEVELQPVSAWSCAHGVERWKSNCGCKTGGEGHWTQQWRTPLREAFDWLRDQLSKEFEVNMRAYVVDPWKARDDYIHVILDRSPKSLDKFFATHTHSSRPPSEKEKTIMLKWFELQRHAMLMYTSCAWFFNEVSGIETIQCMQYAARVIQLAQILIGFKGEGTFLKILAKAKSNVPEHKDAAHIYEIFIKPTLADIYQVAAHHAVTLLLDEEHKTQSSFAYRMELKHLESQQSGNLRFLTGHASIRSHITHENLDYLFSVLHLGDHNILAGIKTFEGLKDYDLIIRRCKQAFLKSDLPDLVRVFDEFFPGSTYSLKSLFQDEQRRVLHYVLQSTRKEIVDVHEKLLKTYYPLIVFTRSLGQPLNTALKSSAEVVLNSRIRFELSQEKINIESIRSLLKDVYDWDLRLDYTRINHTLKKTLERIMDRFLEPPHSLDTLKHLEEITSQLPQSPFKPDLWKMQNKYYRTMMNFDLNQFPEEWLRSYKKLGQNLSMKFYTRAQLEKLNAQD